MSKTLKHGTKAMFKIGCRCKPCFNSVKHGKPGTYIYYKCRCFDCKKAEAIAVRKRIHRNLENGFVPDHVHGTLNGYTYWGCRKECCKKAKRDYQRAFFLKRRNKD